MSGCVDVVVAYDVGVVVVRRRVASARVHEERGDNVSISALLEEAVLARSDVHAPGTVSKVLGSVVARVRRLPVLGHRSIWGATKSSLERPVDVVPVRGVPDVSQAGCGGGSSHARDGGRSDGP